MGHVSQIVKGIPPPLRDTYLGFRVQLRILARMNEAEVQVAFAEVLPPNRVFTWLFLYVSRKRESPDDSWNTLTDLHVSQLRENVKLFNMQTFLFALGEDRNRIYEDGDPPIPTWGPGDNTDNAFTPGSMTWPDFGPKQAEAGRKRPSLMMVFVVVIGGCKLM